MESRYGNNKHTQNFLRINCTLMKIRKFFFLQVPELRPGCQVGEGSENIRIEDGLLLSHAVIGLGLNKYYYY